MNKFFVSLIYKNNGQFLMPIIRTVKLFDNQINENSN